MKLHVERDHLRTFQQACIEIDDIKDWAAIRYAIQNSIGQFKNKGWHEHDDMKGEYERLVRIKETMDQKVRAYEY